MGAVKRTLTDHNFYIGVVVGVVVIPHIMGRTNINVKVPRGGNSS